MDLAWFMLGFPLVYLKGMRIMMFQLSGFYCKAWETQASIWPHKVILGEASTGLNHVVDLHKPEVWCG